MPDPRQGQPRTNERKCGIQPAHQSLITDVFRSRPLLCTIHHLINFTLASVENVPVVRAVLDRGHQNDRTPRLPGAAPAPGQSTVSAVAVPSPVPPASLPKWSTTANRRGGKAGATSSRSCFDCALAYHRSCDLGRRPTKSCFIDLWETDSQQKLVEMLTFCGADA
jgi:hypothetical protein